jgi:hypothetical protein
VAQFLVRDLPGREDAQRVGRLSDWQSGFLFADGRPKPLAAVLPAPLHVERDGDEMLRLWGRIRPGEGRRRVRIEAIGAGGARRVAFEGRTDERGVIERTLRATPGTRLRIARQARGRWVAGPAVGAVDGR